MEPRTTLPFDILVSIIDLFAGGDDGDISSLQCLSQACKFMVPLCRKHLFSSLHIPSSKSKLEDLSELLSKNPDIAHYVKSLHYVVYIPIGDHELNILDVLKEFSPLQSIELQSLATQWDDFPESIRSSLVFLIHLPTVVRLSMQSFKGFPAIALSRCSNLVDLQLRGRLQMAPPEVNQVIQRNKIPTLFSLSVGATTFDCLAILLNCGGRHAGGSIIDVSRLQRASFDVDSPGHIGLIIEFIKVTTRLEYFNLTLDSKPVELTGLGASLAMNAYQTLKSLELRITIVGDDYDPLCGLSPELRFLARTNVLEKLELQLMVRGGVSCKTQSKDWSTFDSLLTQSGGFPMLHRVSVHILWRAQCEIVDDESRWENLQADKFPRLMESKAVEFDLSAEGYKCCSVRPSYVYATSNYK
ncbi:hypothetical protein M413DRAFT_256753 [Hebeloma cylindrosporum]|uniref:F-box domain-containing protein n=1 Tax=Hebeloma cylindrosporum TaxID=76867 RepID=A0A0C3C2H4_HEBCY|nr:hypothetical protein M413DRAFT_256753 [Hebeloma cylindrosporum h7]